ncbi:MAG: YajQ family cyclic di-GMP-binding protein [Candidatus Tectomicrobia bacterium]|nr:YajQ family cyclic di-GMP-binding protein [Candidatus Tectomicrobia bacterium]
MPSFDIVSRTDIAEVDNALNGIRREIAQRFDFKNSKCTIERLDETLTLVADDDFKLKQMHDLLATYLTRRKVDAAALDHQAPEKAAGGAVRQKVVIRQGVGADLARKIVKAVKGSKLKVQVAIQGDELRVSGKKRDDLQAAITLVKDLGPDQPLQSVNFRD